MQIPDYISASYIKNCYKNTSLSKSKSSKKLASGYRINTAADDAAKLSISEKMRAQIRGLDQGVQNAQDAYSLCQTIDGKAQSCHALLQRGRELTLQAANGTNTEQDRGMIQQEIDQLIKELTRISSGMLDGSNIGVTKRCILEKEDIQDILRRYDFPEIKSPLYSSGNKELEKKTAEIIMGVLGTVQFYNDFIEKIDTMPMNDSVIDQILKDAAKCAYQLMEKTAYGGGDLDWAEIIKKMNECVENPAENLGSTTDYLESIRFKGSPLTNRLIVLTRGILAIAIDAKWANEHLTSDDEKRAHIKMSLNSMLSAIFEPDQVLDRLAERPDLVGTQLLIDFREKKMENVYRGIQDMIYGRNYDGSLRDQKSYEMYVQVGANAGHAIKLTFSHLEFYNLHQENGLSEEAAKQMLQAVDLYLGELSDFIAAVGSYQNRLQHAMEYAMEHAEIETGAESRIRDTDYGKEAVEHAKQNLQQQVQETIFAEEKRRKEQINRFLHEEK